mmetsp:Transcript_56943/g.101935  ORF Transcript_56943/g.101935 Transcript_56943/m.101935 type:complete len:161 (-) Transcript_56943:248-730(-)
MTMPSTGEEGTLDEESDCDESACPVVKLVSVDALAAVAAAAIDGRLRPEEEAACEELCASAERGDVEVCQRLLGDGSIKDVNWRRPSDGNSALHLAAEEGHCVAVQVLIAAGACSQVTNNFGLTPIALADRGSEVYRLLDETTKPHGESRRAALRDTAVL